MHRRVVSCAPSLRREDGFSLVEVMGAVALVVILASLALPAFRTFTGRAKRSEMVAVFAHFRDAQRAYMAEHDGVWTTDSSALGFDTTELAIEPDGIRGRYYYFTLVVDAPVPYSLATANLDDDESRDIWAMPVYLPGFPTLLLYDDLAEVATPFYWAVFDPE